MPAKKIDNKGVVVKPIVSQHLNSRGQVDFINFNKNLRFICYNQVKMKLCRS